MATTQYVFSHFEKTESIQSYARDRIEAVLEKFHFHKIFASRVRLQMSNSPQHPGKDSYSCEVMVKLQRFPTLVIKKTSENLYDAISIAADKLLNLLSRTHEKKISRRRLARHL